MEEAASHTRIDYFADEVSDREFHRAVVKFFGAVQKRIVARYLAPENTHRMRHGGEWTHPGLPSASGGEMQQHSSETEIAFDDLVNHDLKLIDRFDAQLEQDIGRQFATMIYSTANAACEQSGNVVDAKAIGSVTEAFAAMLEKIQFSADKDGKVNLPEIPVGPEAAVKLEKALKEAPPEFSQRIEEIKARKIAEALQREVERKARFVRYGEQ